MRIEVHIYSALVTFKLILFCARVCAEELKAKEEELSFKENHLREKEHTHAKRLGQ
jgi:hypothetical protein